MSTEKHASGACFSDHEDGTFEPEAGCDRNAARTWAHVLVVMPACLLVRELRKAWEDLEGTMEVGLDHQKVCARWN